MQSLGPSINISPFYKSNFIRIAIPKQQPNINKFSQRSNQLHTPNI